MFAKHAMYDPLLNEENIKSDHLIKIEGSRKNGQNQLADLGVVLHLLLQKFVIV